MVRIRHISQINHVLLPFLVIINLFTQYAHDYAISGLTSVCEATYLVFDELGYIFI